MSVIQLEIDDMLIRKVGEKAVKSYIEQQMSLLQIQYLGDKIKTEIQHSGIDNQQEIKEARQEAWQEYKEKHLQDLGAAQK